MFGRCVGSVLFSLRAICVAGVLSQQLHWRGSWVVGCHWAPMALTRSTAHATSALGTATGPAAAAAALEVAVATVAELAAVAAYMPAAHHKGSAGRATTDKTVVAIGHFDTVYLYKCIATDTVDLACSLHTRTMKLDFKNYSTAPQVQCGDPLSIVRYTSGGAAASRPPYHGKAIVPGLDHPVLIELPCRK